MSQRLFIELYLDEDVDILIADLWRGLKNHHKVGSN